MNLPPVYARESGRAGPRPRLPTKPLRIQASLSPNRPGSPPTTLPREASPSGADQNHECERAACPGAPHCAAHRPLSRPGGAFENGHAIHRVGKGPPNETKSRWDDRTLRTTGILACLAHSPASIKHLTSADAKTARKAPGPQRLPRPPPRSFVAKPGPTGPRTRPWPAANPRLRRSLPPGRYSGSRTSDPRALPTGRGGWSLR